MSTKPNTTPPFALSDAELAEVEGFAQRSGLDQIYRLCRELRTIRRAYLEQSETIGRMRQMIHPDPQRRFAHALEAMTDAPPKS